jgi:hypothetical protein
MGEKGEKSINNKQGRNIFIAYSSIIYDLAM